MTPKHLVRRLTVIVATLAALTSGVIGMCAAPAFADPLPSPGFDNHAVAPVQIVVSHGMPSWQIALIAIAAAVVASIAAVALDRARSARHHLAPQAS